MQKLAGDQASAFSGVQRAMDTRRDGISDHEFWDGMDLRKMLDRRGRLSPVISANVTLQITEGLQYLHEREHPVSLSGSEARRISVSEKTAERESWIWGVCGTGRMRGREPGIILTVRREQFTRGNWRERKAMSMR